jgi:hypothetical protein
LDSEFVRVDAIGAPGGTVSDHSVTLVSVDPLYVPSLEQIQRAEALARSMFPQADAISPQPSDGIRLFDAGSNFERVTCPGCGAQVELDWWQAAMDADFDGQGFRLEPQAMPCCRRRFALNQLNYDWPQAFARFGLQLMNPNVGTLPADAVAQIEAALGTSVNVIYAHL